METDVDGARARRARASVALVELAGLAAVSRFRLPRGFALDDAWIHQVVARQFARTGVLAFDPALPGSGATSWLWAALLSLNPLAFHVFPPLFTTALASLFLLAAGQLVYALAVADGAPLPEAALASLSFVASGNVLWFALSGMEVTLVMLLTLAAVWAWFRDASARSAGIAGAALVALFFTRPEGALLGVLLVAVRRRRLRDAALLLGPLAFGVALYTASNISHTGHALPITFQGRSWLAEVGLLGATRLDIKWLLLQAWFDRLAEYTLGTPSPLVFFAVLGLALFGVQRLLAARRARLVTLCAWALLHGLSYAAFLPSLGHGGRYQPFIPAAFCLCAATGALRLGTLVAARIRFAGLSRFMPWVFVLPLAACLVRAIAAWGDANGAAVAHEERTEVGMGRSVAALPADAVVASFDIGAIVYFSGRHVEDLGGLVRPEIVPFLRQGLTVSWLRKIGATHLVLPLGYRPDLPEPFNFGEILSIFGSSGLRLTQLEDKVTPFDDWLAGVRATSNSAPRQRLYRVTWQGEAR
jgi:hypothetical protein